MTDDDASVGAICARWWRGAIAGDSGLARMNGAQLRRADGPLAALSVAAVHGLNRDLRQAGHRPAPDRLALIGAALAHVTQGQGPRPAQAFGRGEPKPLSPIRFNALIRARETGDLWRPLIRALAMVKGQVNPAALARDIFYWNDSTRTSWCFDYHGEAFATPTSEETPT